MSAHTPHELHEEFPQDAEVLHRLKLSDAHFNNLASRYHAVNRAIHRIESGIEPASDAFAEQMKRQRLALLDEIALMVERAEGAMAHA
ncbi:MAG: DUF465 domain-containing protein [Erythrobacter sp.]|jgi:uncharacterized protein YdcH (DUF465 family)|nr:DUF465 domain-containing protein [Erythrobacter sp.]